MPNRRRVQCGATECHREYHRARVLRWQHEYLDKHGEWANAKFRRVERKSNRTCVACAAPVGHGRTPQTRCRKCCKKRWTERKAQADRERKAAELAEYMSRPARARRELARAAAGTAGSWPFAQGRCHSCGEQFVCRVTNTLPQYCSQTCLGREAKGRRRALQKGCNVTPARRYRVFERDNWVCRICGDPVNRDAKVPELDAPVVDHRIPLAAGGDHGFGNWQTAHYYCNSVKRDQLNFDFATEAA